ncbi:MAG TPA: hypothetical protein VEU11_01280 [Terriglobales bacterium]|nr:hypothetical protein [Terriglobales bacterium]
MSTADFPDENKAPYIPPDVAPTAYHCPRTTCDGHHYLADRDLGQETVCQKCGLAVTIGHRQLAPAIQPASPNALPASSVPALLSWCLAALLVGGVIGFVVAFVVR